METRIWRINTGKAQRTEFQNIRRYLISKKKSIYWDPVIFVGKRVGFTKCNPSRERSAKLLSITFEEYLLTNSAGSIKELENVKTIGSKKKKERTHT